MAIDPDTEVVASANSMRDTAVIPVDINVPGPAGVIIGSSLGIFVLNYDDIPLTEDE